MSLIAKHKELVFGVGDRIRVTQKIEEAGKSRSSIFEGIVLGIKGSSEDCTFLVRKIGEAGIGIERIFPIKSPTIEKIELIKQGMPGVRHAKLYYTRVKSPKEIEEIFSRAHAKNKPVVAKSKAKKHAFRKK